LHEETRLLLFLLEQFRAKFADECWFSLCRNVEGRLIKKILAVEEGTILWSTLLILLPNSSGKEEDLPIR
jgi:hypothetical protein